MSERMNLMVDDGVGDLLAQLAGGERKRGEYLSSLVRGLAETQGAPGLDVTTLQYAVQGHSGELASVKGRLAVLENEVQRLNAQVSALIAKGA